MGHSTPPPTKIATDSEQVYEELKESSLAILCGRNNSGKSFLLRKLIADGEEALYLGPSRYQNFTVLSSVAPSTDTKESKWTEQRRHALDKDQNLDNSPLNLAQAISRLTDEKREKLFALVDKLLGTTTDTQQTVPNNSMSQQYIRVDKFNLSYTSSGFRLVMTLLTSLLDTDYTTFLIDEPELGLSPETQAILANTIYKPECREKYFAHVKSFVIATHSPAFLDRQNIQNNYIVSRTNSDIAIKQVETVQDINSLQFFLLGNRFENLYLPSAIVLVEGPCDCDFVKRLVALRFPDSNISVIHGGGDSRIRDMVHFAREIFANIGTSPYADRFFVIVDSVHGSGLVDAIVSMGIPKKSVIVWGNNGIEYVYPRTILEKKFGAFSSLTIEGDVVSANGIRMKKKELSEFVVARMTKEDELPDELEKKFLSKLKAIIY